MSESVYLYCGADFDAAQCAGFLKEKKVDVIEVEIAKGVRASSCFALLEKAGYRMSHQKRNKYYFYHLVSGQDSQCCGYLDQIELGKLSKYTKKIKFPQPYYYGCQEASCFLQPKRFDVAIKALCARLFLLKCSESWVTYAYLWHLEKITGSNKYIHEHDDSGKSGEKEFIKNFRSLLTDLTPEQIPLVPVDSKNVAFDGSHRIAAALACQRSLCYVRLLEATSSCNADSNFFSSAVKHSVEKEFLDAAAVEYCRLKQGLALALIFPVVTNPAPAIELLNNVAEPVYYKKVSLPAKAGRRFLRQVYLGHDWMDNEANSAGFKDKVRSCFPVGGELRAILLDNFHPGELRKVKEKIRQLYGLGNHSIHITDSDEETLRVARIVFNANSLLFLQAEQDLDDALHKKLAKFAEWLESIGENEEDFCLDGGIIMHLLGLREGRDVDFLYGGSDEFMVDTPSGIDCHNSENKISNFSIKDIVYNPSMHGWYMGIKFSIPEILLENKKKRGEFKDQKDIAFLQFWMKTHKRSSRSWFTVFICFLKMRCELYIYIYIYRWAKKILRPIVNLFR